MTVALKRRWPFPLEFQSRELLPLASEDSMSLLCYSVAMDCILSTIASQVEGRPPLPGRVVLVINEESGT